MKKVYRYQKLVYLCIYQLRKTRVMKIGDKIKTFEVKQVVKGIYVKYDDKGNKTKTVIDFYFLLSKDGQQRVLASNRKSLRDCVTYTPTFSHKSKFITWNQFEIVK